MAVAEQMLSLRLIKWHASSVLNNFARLVSSDTPAAIPFAMTMLRGGVLH